MTAADFDEHLDRFLTDMRALLAAKGADYVPPGPDVLGNFRQAAAGLGLTPRQVLAVFTNKHFSSVLAWARDGREGSEPVRGRFLDLAAYCVLGAALAADGETP